MAKRYEIRPFRQSSAKNKIKGNKKINTYGVWDNKINKWVINSTGIGLEKAQTILYLLENPKPVKNRNNFWKD